MMRADQLARLYADHIAALQTGWADALAGAGWDAALLHSGTARLQSTFDDRYWPLRTTPHFAHWLPLLEPDCALLLRPGARPVLYRNTGVSFWEGLPEPESDHFWSAFDVVEVSDPDRIKELRPAGVRTAFIGEEMARAAAWGFAPEAVNPVDLMRRVDALRTRKSAYEVACVAEANRRAAAGHHRVIDAFRAGDPSEFDLHLLYLAATGQDDPDTPYKNIVALGEHAATLHHVAYGRRQTGAQSILLDAGATCLGYASDITRTAVKGGGAGAAAFAALIAGVEKLQQEIVGRVAAGLPYEQLHNQSHQLLAPVLREVGIAKASEGELVDAGITRAFFPHGLGHSLGLQTHDVGCAVIRPEPRNPYLRNTSTVTAGQVFTIEPGCYFIDSLLAPLRESPLGADVDWKLVDELRRFGGVRIEDDVLVEPAGVRNLTREVLPS